MVIEERLLGWDEFIFGGIMIGKMEGGGEEGEEGKAMTKEGGG